MRLRILAFVTSFVLMGSGLAFARPAHVDPESLRVQVRTKIAEVKEKASEARVDDTPLPSTPLPQTPPVETAVPPAPVVVETQQGSIQDIVLGSFPWPNRQKTLSVAACESGGWSRDVIYGPREGAAGERSGFQIHPGHYDGRWGGPPIVKTLGYSWDDMWVPEKAAHVAWELSRHGTNFGPWTCA